MQQEYYYRNRKQITFLDFCRNVLIARVPETLSTLTRILIRYEPDFIFLTHPRNEDDIYATFPFIRKLNRILPKRVVLKILNLSPCYIVSCVEGAQNIRGYFVSIVELPERLFSSRELTMKLIQASTSFIRKISKGRVFVGLAAWWPIVSNSGLLFQRFVRQVDNLVVTSGHTATLASIYLTVLKLSQILEIPMRQLKLLIIGVGKVGGALADVMVKDVGKIGLLDRNRLRLDTVKKNLEQSSSTIKLEIITVNHDNSEEVIARKLQEFDIAICTTSSTGLLITDEGRLNNCIILDDSRPEAFPRIFSESRKAIVLEGGLMKIPNVKMDSDFGFGKEDNVFGCLAEAMILAMNHGSKVKPNTGEVDYNNLFNLIDFCRASNIEPGDFKCGQMTVTPEQIKTAFLPARSHS